MVQFSLSNLTNALNDEDNLPQALPALIPGLNSIADRNADAALLAKLHARLSTLIQSKSVKVRWCGICLVKAALSRPDGKFTTLISHGATWMKLLLKILEREDNDVLIERTIATLADIITLTRGKPSLTRDITTPSLPTLLTHVFSILSRPTPPQLSKCLLYHVQIIMYNHSTTFRPFAGKLQAYVTGLLNGSCTDPELVELAARAYASLHVCAPKNTSSEQWTTGFSSVMGECHDTLSYIYQVVVEERRDESVQLNMNMLKFSSEFTSQVPLALRRLDSLLQTLVAFVSMQTKEPVKVPLGQTMEFMHRMLEITPTSGIKASTPRSTQLALIDALPQVHALGYTLYCALLRSFGSHLYPHAYQMEAFMLRDADSEYEDCQTAALHALSESIGTLGFIDSAGDHKIKLLETFRRCAGCLGSLVPKSHSKSMTASRTNGQSQGTKKRKHGVQAGSDQISDDSAFHVYPSGKKADVCFELLTIMLKNTHDLITKKSRWQLEMTVLRILTSSNQLDRRILLLLLKMLKVILIAPDVGRASASILSICLGIAQKYSSDHDPEIRHVAIKLVDDLELFIHARLPATSQRLPILTEEEMVEEDESVMPAESTEEPVVLSKEERQESPNVEIPAPKVISPMISHTELPAVPSVATIQSEASQEQPEPQAQKVVDVEEEEELAGMPLPTPATEKLLADQFIIDQATVDPVQESVQSTSREPQNEKRIKTDESQYARVAKYEAPDDDESSDEEGMPEICMDDATDFEDDDDMEEDDEHRTSENEK